ncbi:MAG: hypothetical protein HWE26_06870 [Alteromonadaceae bacterium]|nr:hypothetical protein [Alteromonadaceae bacterium]
MKKRHIKIIAFVTMLVGMFFSLQSFLAVEFELNPNVWFTADYYLQFIPLYISVSFLLCGVFVLTGYSRVNFYLAMFGHATSEEILFSLIGLATTPLPFYAIIIFLPASLIALWVAYANKLQQKRVSVGEAIFGIIFSTAFILLPRYL